MLIAGDSNTARRRRGKNQGNGVLGPSIEDFFLACRHRAQRAGAGGRFFSLGGPAPQEGRGGPTDERSKAHHPTPFSTTSRFHQQSPAILHERGCVAYRTSPPGAVRCRPVPAVPCGAVQCCAAPCPHHALECTSDMLPNTSDPE